MSERSLYFCAAAHNKFFSVARTGVAHSSWCAAVITWACMQRRRKNTDECTYSSGDVSACVKCSGCVVRVIFVTSAHTPLWGAFRVSSAYATAAAPPPPAETNIQHPPRYP
eukprot:7374433-Prymnesium_polylepis.1